MNSVGCFFLIVFVVTDSGGDSGGRCICSSFNLFCFYHIGVNYSKIKSSFSMGGFLYVYLLKAFRIEF